MLDKSAYPLQAWGNGHEPLPKRFYLPAKPDHIDSRWCCWVNLEEVLPLHLAAEAHWQGMDESRACTSDYLERASEEIGGLCGGWLDHEESHLLRQYLGEPPLPCLPIYFIALERDGTYSEPLYIGITSSSCRFANGHKAALWLHDDKYAGYRKVLFRAAVWFHDGTQYLPLEWMLPHALAAEMLESIESQLIYDYQPVMNERKRANDCATKPIDIHLQSYAGSDFIATRFLVP
ncbi:hypothetical protein [Aeoliella mucimassa]|uniref:Uncharacterized protein n=1 Tax=Aeoliella mucimassa TaxID=2527972 RepID=A0A518AHF8_9BACT|nr:hypothetical protein [Aeoliella mucimassa]QDU54159.1 hypothetical protein Pan181_03390 [Aeoliella mucimassa]